ncbi:MAG: glycosyltransferase family 39 protein [Desulfobacterales bacterium]|nr:MAG: glycosyltransferase family 39 protein [Desulfobacterales bacterium]
MKEGKKKTSQQTYRTLFWVGLACITGFRLLFIGKFGLGVDESHYLLYSRHLAWGYFDHPPMVAFLAALTTLLGDSVFFVRLGPVLCSVISLILLRYLALALYRDERVALWAMLLLHLMPYQHLLLVGLLPDAVLNIFWCGTLLAVWRALQTGKWSMWILAGLLFGGALLSKYHAVLLALCLLGYFITSPEHRFWLRRIQPYVAVVLGLAVFGPNIIWNVRHGWISYAYQLGQGGGDGLDPGKFLAGVAGQAGAWSPIIFGLLIAVVVVMVRQKKTCEADRFAAWTSMPIFALFCLIGLTSSILPHWTSAGWWTGSIVVSAVISQKLSFRNPTAGRWRRWSVAAAVTGFIMTAMVYLALFLPITAPVYTWARDISLGLNRKFPAIKPLKPFETGFDPANELFGWQNIARQVENIRAQMPRPANTFVFGHRFHTSSQLAVYLDPDTAATSLYHRYSQYRLWFNAEDYTGWDALFVVDRKRHQERARRYKSLFTKMDPQPKEIQVFRNGRPAHVMEVYKYYGFKGKYEE